MPLGTLEFDPRGATRRGVAAPPAVDGELFRLRVVELLARRWQATVTTVVAGAGFGKSIALAQALRANQAHPEGIDAWLSCEPGDEDATHLGDGILGALDASRGGHDVAAAVIQALRDLSPVPVCLMIDDVHQLPERSSSARLLAEILRLLPPHAHLVLASRQPLPLPLARLRATESVLDITEGTLAYTADETRTLARRVGHDPAALEPLAGWPALVRLALVAPTAAPRQFLWEEVVERLTDGDRRALLALATLGTADSSSLTELCGEQVDVDHLAGAIPLVAHTGNGEVRAHDLWNDALASIEPAEDVHAMGRAAGAHLLARGSYLRAGSLASRIGDIEGLCRASLTLVRNTMSALPVNTAAGWLRAAPIHERERPELVLLDAAVRHASDNRDPSVSRLLELALGQLRERRDAPGEHVALTLRLVVAHSQGDVGTVLEVAEAAKHLPTCDLDPALAALTPVAAATEASLLGEPERAAALLDTLNLAALPPLLAAAVLRLHWHMLVLSGRAEEAAQLGGDTLSQGSTPNAPLFQPMARWLAGDPSGFEGAEPDGLDVYERRGATSVPYARDWFNHGIFTAMVWASAGDVMVVGRALHLLASVDLDTNTGRNGAPLAVARAAHAIVRHDDTTAENVLDAFVADHPLGDRLTDVSLRRFLAVPYVCCPEARRRWDSEPLGPSQLLQRDGARALVAARLGKLTAAAALPEPPAIYTALPLPWSVELAVRAHAAGNPAGRRLAQWLIDRHAPAARNELRRLAASGDATLARAADHLLTSIPYPPEHTTRLEVLGPLRLLVEGELVERSEQRRGRVRELLSVLVSRGTVTRDRVMELLWPDLAADDAARNLRVTLTHLRKLLEPDRSSGDNAYHLRVEREHLHLVASNRLTVDLWELRHHLKGAAAARTASDLEGQAGHLAAAVGLWRDDPLPDLERVSELCPEVDHLRLQLVDATLALGELRLSEGAPALTLACAERALAADPYNERAFRLLVAAHLQSGGRAQAYSAGQRTLATLEELGVEPEPQTAILLRRAGAAPQRS